MYEIPEQRTYFYDDVLIKCRLLWAELLSESECACFMCAFIDQWLNLDLWFQLQISVSLSWICYPVQGIRLVVINSVIQRNQFEDHRSHQANGQLPCRLQNGI
jgi:hypothetical protein